MAAQDEIIRRIKQLDTEETKLRALAASRLREASKVVEEANGITDAAEKVACVRRQYEYALTVLGSEMPKIVRIDDTGTGAIAIPVKVS